MVRQFCKRPCFHDEYLQTFNRPNVTLVDTEGGGVEPITPRGVVANGVEFDLDCLLFGTGFEVGTDYSRRAGCTIIGRDGVTLAEKCADGVGTLHGINTRGFPDLSIMNSAQSGFTANFPHALDEQARHIAYIVDRPRSAGATVVEAGRHAEDAWVQTIIELARMGQSFLESCTPGYYNNEGKPNERAAQNGFYGAGPVAFFNLLAAWRDEGSMAGLELTITPRSVRCAPRPRLPADHRARRGRTSDRAAISRSSRPRTDRRRRMPGSANKDHAQVVDRRIRTGEVEVNGGGFNPVAPSVGSSSPVAVASSGSSASRSTSRSRASSCRRVVDPAPRDRSGVDTHE